MKNFNGYKILVVDDNEYGRYATSKTIKNAGFNVIEAATGKEAIDLALKEKPDLIVLDVNLPDINGLEVCRRIKSEIKTTFIPIIHLSATYVKTSDKIAGLEFGADGYLVHPIDKNELIATIHAFLRLKDMQRKLAESEQQFRNIAENALDMICRFLFKPQPRYVYVNPAATKMIGYTPEEHYADPYLRMKIIHPDDKEKYEQLMVEKHFDAKPVELRFIHKNGNIVWVEIRQAPIYSDDGEIIGFDSICRDITEKKIAEQEKEKLIEQLKAALAEVKTLRGFIPICTSCKKVRNDKGYWEAIESYLQQHSEAEFTHSLCPECIRKLYPEYADEIERNLSRSENK